MSDTSSGPVRSGTAAQYRERLLPAIWIWCSAALLAALIGLVAVPFGVTAGVAAGIVGLVLLVAVLVAWSPVIAVSDGELVAGRAHVPVTMLGSITPLDGSAMRQALGPGFDARAFLCIRGWIATGVRAELVDPDDPTPYWLISSRRPQALAEALRQARGVAEQR